MKLLTYGNKIFLHTIKLYKVSFGWWQNCTLRLMAVKQGNAVQMLQLHPLLQVTKTHKHRSAINLVIINYFSPWQLIDTGSSLHADVYLSDPSIKCYFYVSYKVQKAELTNSSKFYIIHFISQFLIIPKT